MDLKTFVAESLTQIAEGIAEAQKTDSGAIINPRINYTDKGTPKLAGNTVIPAPQMVSFDVAVHVTKSDNDKAGGRIGVSFLGMGGESSSANENSSSSRIKFEIPVIWPEGKK